MKLLRLQNHVRKLKTNRFLLKTKHVFLTKRMVTQCAFYKIFFFSCSIILVHHLHHHAPSHRCEGFSLEIILRLQKEREGENNQVIPLKQQQQQQNINH